jgi:predicted PurR-regulated permease PerM
MRSQTAARVLFAGLLVLTLYLMYLIFKPLLPGIAWAMVLAVAFQPVYDRLVRWFRGWSWSAAVLLSALVAAFIVVPAVLAVVRVGQGVVQAYTWLDQKVAAEVPGPLGLGGIPWVRDAAEWLGQYVDLSKIDLQAMALSVLKTLGNALASRTTGFVADALATLMTLIVMLVTMAVLFHEGPRLVSLVRQFLPLSESDKEEVFRQLRAVTRSVFFGVLFTALMQAVLGGIGIAIVGLPAAVTFGAAMFFCALLPAGTVIVWGPAALWLLATGHPWKALFLVIWGIAVVSSADNFLRPLFIGRGVQLHTLLVFFGILGGMLAFGLVGLFVGPLVITLFLFLLEIAKRDFFRDAAPPPTA